MSSSVHSRRSVVAGAVAAAAALPLGGSPLLAAEPVVHEVRITGFAFVPARIEVSPGDVVRWTNEDLAPHTDRSRVIMTYPSHVRDHESCDRP